MQHLQPLGQGANNLNQKMLKILAQHLKHPITSHWEEQIKASSKLDWSRSLHRILTHLTALACAALRPTLTTADHTQEVEIGRHKAQSEKQLCTQHGSRD